MTPVAVALGANLGDRHAALRQATASLRGLLRDIRVSPFYETIPVGVDEQPTFLNAAAVGDTTLSAAELLRRLLQIEQAFGRARPFPGAPRTLDLDLILYGDVVLDVPGLVVPHPRFRERAFVLQPLADVAADWIDPVSCRTVGQLLEMLPAGSRAGVRLSDEQ